MWQGLTSTQRQTPELNLGPSLAARTRLLYFNRMQSRVVTGLLAGHNTLKRHLYTTGLIDSLACRRCGAEEETSAHILCQCEALATLRHMKGSFFFDPQDVRSLGVRVIWNFIEWTGLPRLGLQSKGHKGPVKDLRASGPKGLKPIIYLPTYQPTKQPTYQPTMKLDIFRTRIPCILATEDKPKKRCVY